MTATPSYPYSDAAFPHGLHTTNGGPLKVHYQNGGFQHIVPGLSLQQARSPPLTKIPPRRRMTKDVTESEKIVNNAAITGKTWKVSSNKGK